MQLEVPDSSNSEMDTLRTKNSPEFPLRRVATLFHPFLRDKKARGDSKCQKAIKGLLSAMTATRKQVVLVTGGNTGIGFEIVRKLLRDHPDVFDVVIGCRTAAKGKAAIQELEQQGYAGAEAIQIELTDDDSIAAAAREAGQRFGRLDVLVANVQLIFKPWLLGDTADSS